MAQVKDLICYGPAKFNGRVDRNEWYGTLEEYDNIPNKDPNVLYYIV